MMSFSKPKKYRRASEYADPYSLAGEEKYPEELIRKRAKAVPSSSNNAKEITFCEKEKVKKNIPDAGQHDSNILEPPMETKSAVKCEFPVPEWEDHFISYKRLLSETRSYLALNFHFTVYAVLDFDVEKNILMKSAPLLVQRKADKFYCSCDNIRQSFIEKVDSCNREDVDRFYPPCLHIKAVKSIHNALISSTGIAAENNADAVGEHQYSINMNVESEDCNILEVPFLEDVYAAYHKSSYGLLSVSFGTIKCLSCKRQNCHHCTYLNDLLSKFEVDDLPEILEKIYITMFQYKNTSYHLECLSKEKIPYNLPQELNAKIWKSPDELFIKEDGTFKVFDIDVDSCPFCGDAFNDNFIDVRKKTDCIMITKYRMAEVQCFNKVCCNKECGQVTYYDGQNDCLLNMGRFLVHYEVLRDYMHHFLFSRTTMFSFYTVWSKHQKDSGNHHFQEKFPLPYFRWAWYSFLRLLDIDYKQSFICEDCGDQPRILLFDGTTLSFQKSFLGHLNSEESSSVKLEGSHKDRTFISHPRTRKMLAEYANRKKKHEGPFFKELCLLIEHNKPVLSMLMNHLEMIGGEDCCPDEYRNFLKILSSNSAVCGTFHARSIYLVEQLLDLKDIMSNVQFLQNLQTHIPFLFNFITGLNCVPKFVRPVLEEIIIRTKNPFLIKPHQRDLTQNQDSLAFFPNLPKLFTRGIYKMDKIKSDPVCSKKGTKHPSLLPGIFTVFCQHGICYGFEVMECAESPNRPFTFLKTRFRDAPEVVIYDNSCNLHSYCLNRDPGFFRDTIFVVDGLHWDNHSECSIGYQALSYPFLRNINTQMVEQNNSKLKKLKGSLSYMKPENFIDTLGFFLWNCNENCKNAKIKKKVAGLL